MHREIKEPKELLVQGHKVLQVPKVLKVYKVHKVQLGLRVILVHRVLKGK